MYATLTLGAIVVAVMTNLPIQLRNELHRFSVQLLGPIPMIPIRMGVQEPEPKPGRTVAVSSSQTISLLYTKRKDGAAGGRLR